MLRGSKRSGGAMVFARKNYIILLTAVAVVVLGYVVMRVENQVEGFLSLYVGPLLVLGGYLGVIYAILWREKPVAATERE